MSTPSAAQASKAPQPAAQAAAPASAYLLTQRIVSEGYPPMTMRVKASTGRVRVEMDVPDSPGIYFILQPESRVAIVTPAQRMVVLMDASAMAAGQKAAAALGISKLSGVTVDVTDLGPGETILGHPTHKYRIRQRYTVTITMANKPHDQKYDATVEESIATDLPGYAAGFDKFVATFGNSFSGVRGGSAKELLAALKGKLPAGFPLRAVVKETSTVPDAQPATAVTTTEVTAITKTTVAAGDFTVPAAYQVMDMNKLNAKR